ELVATHEDVQHPTLVLVVVPVEHRKTANVSERRQESSAARRFPPRARTDTLSRSAARILRRQPHELGIDGKLDRVDRQATGAVRTHPMSERHAIDSRRGAA